MTSARAHEVERRALLIAGPTAGGKSALATSIAERHGGAVINADAMAVYRDLRILTGRPTDTELRRVPHALFAHVDAADRYSVGRWLVDVAEVLHAAWVAGRLPIIVGGTGLYFKALTTGLSEIPPVPADVRASVEAIVAQRGPAALHALLAARDPETARHPRPTDPQRIIRALEVFETTGRPLAHFQAERSPPLLESGQWLGIVLAPERSGLRLAIDRRFDAMMAQGAPLEIETLARRGLDPALPAMRALGVPPLLAHRAGALALDAAVARAKAETRHYARRQTTFARHQLPGFLWVEDAGLAEAAADAWLAEGGSRPS